MHFCALAASRARYAAYLVGAAALALPMSAWADGTLVVTITPAGRYPTRMQGATVPAVITVGRSAQMVGEPVRFSRALFSSVAVALHQRAERTQRSTIGSLPIAGTVTSGFGMRLHPLLGIHRFHSGVDLAAAKGTVVSAPSSGTVTRAQWAGGYGLLVELDNGNDTMRFAHLSRISVAVGQQVRQGETVGYVGATGLATGAHLHYEVRKNGHAIDPLDR
ncbi:MAG TPA: M23 family peptidase [Sphingobium sp.]|jgi:murein DD-endopeptidase MepM/ murein hydrolase activator NlpD|uniref:M23 family metallopeptidase n=1 Tax=Sphingobium sp. TaxID=1912891 RepID=UPI000EC4ADC8|nr:M23 family metallopeptidase [Sphingobium sp.]HAF42772.1 M23 family peptidase [Sphingobium sp.]